MTSLPALRSSIGRKYALVLVASMSTVGILAVITGTGVVEQVTAMLSDSDATASMIEGRDAVMALRKMRRSHVEHLVRECVEDRTWPSCPAGELSLRVETSPPADKSASGEELEWRDEKTLAVAAATASGTVHIAWKPLKPVFEGISDQIATREHVERLLPQLTRSFGLVFALVLVFSTLLGLVVIWFLSRNLRRRMRGLIEYTRSIAASGGSGDVLLPRELSTAQGARGKLDEIDLLTSALSSMSGDLASARRRLVLTEKMSSWQNAARKVAHEIKNPLTPITLVAGELQRLSTTSTLPQNLRSSLEQSGRILSEETESLGRMVQEFTAFARLPEPKLETLDLGEIVRDFVTRNSGQKNVTLTLESEGPKIVLADRGMIHQIFHNLVTNARLAKQPTPVTVSFRFEISPLPDSESAGSAATQMLRLQITDDGPGVPETLRNTLFDAYVTTRSTGDGEKGMGLGLTIARKIAHDHLGTLELVRSDSTGTTFELCLPRKKDEAQ